MLGSMDFRRCSILAGAALALLCGGCATASKPTAMVADSAPVANRHQGSVLVYVSGGSATSAMGASSISDEDFAAAVRDSIKQSGLFPSVVTSGGDYQINAEITRLDRPMFGASFTVTMEVTWHLIRSSDQKVLWEKGVVSQFTATMSDAFAGVTRLRLANEGAARANIKDAIAQMGRLTVL